jgi:crotonobetainyl-CoA:carnitine CoA-transferase CaiB-like acyl-CoA transferase
VLEHTVNESVEIMNASQVPCCAIMTPRDMAEDPHYEARNVHIEWEDLNLGRTVKGTGIAPKFSETPGKIWRGSVPVGHDNEMVFRQLLGITSEDLAKLVEDGVV